MSGDRSRSGGAESFQTRPFLKVRKAYLHVLSVVAALTRPPTPPQSAATEARSPLSAFHDHYAPLLGVPRCRIHDGSSGSAAP
jgi:hypothetical protein